MSITGDLEKNWDLSFSSNAAQLPPIFVMLLWLLTSPN